ncbi:MAG: queuosine precursor transporter [Clostridia bacterium]|nr:queuosine precursor transporter [Clostridia bacterium]
MKAKGLSLWRQAQRDLRAVPGDVVSLFCVSIIVMNLLANKTIYQAGIVAADGGILLSWLAFMCMDVVTKAFGKRIATTLSVFALGMNLFVSLIFCLCSIIPTETDYSGFNTIFGGTWFILLSSSVAFLLSAIVNNSVNESVGRHFRKEPDGRLAYITRSYVSTFVGQFVDNFVFAGLTFMVFAPIYWDGFSWTLSQCVTCSLIGAVLELMMEVLFSPLGYLLLEKWRKEGICKAEGRPQ